jgi:hypothetical protein
MFATIFLNISSISAQLKHLNSHKVRGEKKFLAYHEAVSERFHDLRWLSRDLQRLLPKLT